MLFIANNGKKEDILRKKGRYFSLLTRSFALRFREKYYDCILYKFLEVVGYSGVC